MVSPLHIALVGNPNCGKTSLFNQLTGSTGCVGNWPGVTVEYQEGYFFYQHKKINIIDLPGIYSLDPIHENKNQLDEQIACQYLLNQPIDIIINVVDASNLERHLYLTTQLLQTKLPLIIALNKMDVAKKRGIDFNLEEFSKQLNHPVIPIIASSGNNLEELKKKIREGESAGSYKRERIFFETPEYLTANTRYNFIDQLIKQIVQHKTLTKTNFSTLIDHIVLNRVLSIPIFFTVMYLLFWFALGIGKTLQNFFDTSSHLLFVDGLSHLLHYWHTPVWLIALLANGVGGGINTVITFTPVLGIMFLFLSFLEDSGYMARAAFIMDKVTHTIGLPGKSFIPMILGFACNVPAVMAARTLGSRRDQILTVMMTPFMSCTARLAIYAVFAAVFFPNFAAQAIFCLYLLGVAIALLTGLLLRKTILRGNTAPFMMELPDYHWPLFKSILWQTWQRLWGFLWRAGKLILPVCVLIGMLNTIPDAHNSILSIIGRNLTPLFYPMGIHPNNWPATVGLMTGVLAKEVVIGTLNTLYQPGQMSQQFDGAVGAFAYLIFVLLYFPCVSTIAVVARELGRKWACFSVAWSTMIAYGLAVLFYQIATVTHHPLSAMVYVGGVLGFISLVVVIINYIAKQSSQVDWLGQAEQAGAFSQASTCGKCRQCSKSCIENI